MVRVDDSVTIDRGDLAAMASVCWMLGLDVLLPEQWAADGQLQDKCALLEPAKSIPIRWYLPTHDQDQMKHLPVKFTNTGFENSENGFF